MSLSENFAGRLLSTLTALVGVALSAAACESSVPAADAAFATANAAQVDTRFRQEATDEVPPEMQVAADQVADSRRTAVVRAAERVAPGVVTISTLGTQQVNSFFGPQLRRTGGYGSGFVIDGELGIVLTNEHVVRGAERIQVTLSDGSSFEAELVGADAITDVAVLRVDADRTLPTVPLGTSEELLIGEWALAVGNPVAGAISNSEPTVTTGVISATNRHIVPDDPGGSEAGAYVGETGVYVGMIQTDAAINPGNSGGPLVNVLGQVIGMNSSIFSRSGGSDGLGFAIPIDRALQVAEDLLATGEIRRAWLGLAVEPAEADEWGRTRGVLISEVFAGSPAALAGVRAGRRILVANGRAVAQTLDWDDILLDLREGDPVELVIEGRDAPIVLVTAPYPTQQAVRVQVLDDLDVVSITPQIRAERALRIEEGALVVGITPELTRTTGLREGDVIFRIGNRRIRTAEDLAGVFGELRDYGRPVDFQIGYLRGNQQIVRSLRYGG